jgi:DNA-directed RNA polymerase specialized sigma24 family protein
MLAVNVSGRGLVFAVVRACVRDRDDALDISQNVFLKAFERLDSQLRGKARCHRIVGMLPLC